MLKDSLEVFSLYKGQDMPLAQSISAPKPSGKLNIQLHAAQEELLQKCHFCTLAALVRQEMSASLLADEEAPFPSGFSFACPVDRKFVPDREGIAKPTFWLSWLCRRVRSCVGLSYMYWPVFLWAKLWMAFTLSSWTVISIKLKNWGSLNHRSGFKREAGEDCSSCLLGDRFWAQGQTFLYCPKHC